MPPVLGSFIFFALGKITAAQFLTTAALSLAAKVLTKTPRLETPSVGQQTISRQEPAPARQICYGDAWLAPKWVYTRNSVDYDRDKGPKSYIYLGAVADHPVECWEFHVNGEQFLTYDEQDRLRQWDGKYSWSGIVDDFPTPSVDPLTGERTLGARRPKPDTRRRADKRAAEGTHNHYTMTMFAVSRLRSNLSAPFKPESDPSRRDFNFGTVPLETNSFASMYDALWQDSFRGRVSFPYQSGRYGGTATWPFWYYSTPSDRSIYPDMHLYGTSCIQITFPINYHKNREPMWPTPPNILLGVRRHKDSLQLWDDTKEGAPLVRSEWYFNNAALCAYDYISRYTDFGIPVCGFSRIDLNSVARAADVCNAKNLRANGSVNLDNSPAEVLQQFAHAMGGGRFVEQGGVLYMYAGEYTPPTLAYDEDEIVEGSWGISTPTREQRTGLFDTVYTDTKGARQEVAFHHPRAKENLRINELQLVFVNNLQQARRVAFIENHRAWDSRSVEFTLLPDVPAPSVNEIIVLNFERLGAPGQYRVLQTRNNTEDGTVEVKAISERADIYDAPVTDTYIPPVNPVRSVTDDNPVVDNLLIGQGSASPGFALINGGDRIQLNLPT